MADFDTQNVLDALHTIRAPQTQMEYDLHELVRCALENAHIPCQHEAKLAPRCRIDFLCGRTGIEIKKGRPDRKTVEKQLRRYAETGKVFDIILVSERIVELPHFLLGVKLHPLSLQSLWGVAAETHTDTHPLSDTEADKRENIEIPDEPDAPAAIETEMPAQPVSLFCEKPAVQPGIEDSILYSLHQDNCPAFLRDPDVSLPYGTLSYNARRKCWVIKGDPAVTELGKKLIPAASGGRRGEMRFPDNHRIIGDVNWLMLRYPMQLAPQDKTRWQNALQSARDYYREREIARTAPPAPQLSPAVFDGQLMPFQQSGLAWLTHTNRALLADEMGLGKTVQALACAAQEGIFPLLIVPPPHLTRNWLHETERFLRVNGQAPRIHVIKGLKPYDLPPADVYILHYLLLRGWKTALPEMHFHTVIFDEVQELRRTGSEKYSAASLLSESCTRVMGLSGTPIYNYGGEIWNVINILDYHFLGDWESFSRQWCSGYGNKIVTKPDLLGEHLRHEGLMLRRTKQEVLPQLPEKRRLVQEIDADDALYQSLMSGVWEKLYRWQNEKDMKPSERALLEDRISQEERQATGLAKAPYVCQFVRTLLSAGEKVLLFAHHHAVMDVYAEELRDENIVFITGRESTNAKEKAVDAFMTGQTNLCCISLRAASGLNLQAATCVVFGELDWSPAVHSQAEDRAHRIGQKDSLLVYYLVSPGGSDRDMQDALGLKVSQFLSLMGDTPQSEEKQLQDAAYARQHVESLIKRYPRA